MEHKFLNTGFRVEAVDETGMIEGYASIFDAVDNANDIVVKGAFKDTLNSHHQKGRLPAMLWQHDVREPIGAWQEMFEDSTGLYVKGKLFVDDIPRARQAHRLLQDGGLTGLSIGFKAIESETDPRTGVRHLTKIELMEVSMVTFPAQELARVASVKSRLANGDIPSTRDFENFLRDSGFSRKQAKIIISEGYKMDDPSDIEHPDMAEGGNIEELCALEALTHRILRAIP